MHIFHGYEDDKATGRVKGVAMAGGALLLLGDSTTASPTFPPPPLPASPLPSPHLSSPQDVDSKVAGGINPKSSTLNPKYQDAAMAGGSLVLLGGSF